MEAVNKWGNELKRQGQVIKFWQRYRERLHK